MNYFPRAVNLFILPFLSLCNKISMCSKKHKLGEGQHCAMSPARLVSPAAAGTKQGQVLQTQGSFVPLTVSELWPRSESSPSPNPHQVRALLMVFGGELVRLQKQINTNFEDFVTCQGGF